MQEPDTESWVNVMVRAAGRFGLPADAPAVRQQMRWFENLPLNARLERLSGLMGLQVHRVPLAKMRWSAQNRAARKRRADAAGSAERRWFGDLLA